MFLFLAYCLLRLTELVALLIAIRFIIVLFRCAKDKCYVKANLKKVRLSYFWHAFTISDPNFTS